MHIEIKLAVALGAALAMAVPAGAATLTALTGFGSNPGGLEMFTYSPAGVPAGAPLVVFMHGCSQTAADAAKVGWNELADQLGFHVLYPQQTAANNPIKCFNWAGEYGDPANLTRGMGENESIHQAIVKVIADKGIDARRVYITGFSAGAGFASVMLATWPDLFAGGAIMAGLPYRCATTVNEAYNCQSLASHAELKKTPAQWGALVRAAYPGFTGPYPPVVIFHGSSDSIVSPDNQVELIEQWTDVAGTDQTPDATAMVGNHQVSRFMQGGHVVVESWKVMGMGHAVAMGGADPEHGCAPTGGSYIEDRGLCAVWRAASFFGLAGTVVPPLPDGGVGPGPDGGMPPQRDGGGVVRTDSGVTEPGTPAVALTAPSAGARVSGAVTIAATASADRGVARVEFFVDGVLKGSDGSAPYTQLWQTAQYSAGAHELKAVAYDIYELSGEAKLTVMVGEGGGEPAAEYNDPIGFGCEAAAGRAGARMVDAVLVLGALALAWLAGRGGLRLRARARAGRKS